MRNYFYLFILSVLFISMQSCNLFSAAGLSSQGQPTKEVGSSLTSTTANSTVNVDHSKWDELLEKHVNEEGWVNYKGFQNDREELNLYLQKLSSYEPNDDWSVQELLAYYINLYNAYTVDLILRHPDVESIKDISGAWTNGFVPIGDRNLSLGGIENGILRKMNEPRIHFAINCASISCPKLLNEAYTASKINEQLETVTKEFINGDKNKISPNNPKLSSIFSFYPDDFIVNGTPDVVAYINLYSTVKIQPDANVSYIPYDWGLNDQK
jgi:hypothetical protein